MKFIEIREGFFVNRDDVESIERTDTLSCVLQMVSGVLHNANFPAEAMAQLLSMEAPKEIETVKLEPQAQNALNSLGHHYAG